MAFLKSLLICFYVLVGAFPLCAQQLKGNVSAVYDLLERVMPGTSSHFLFTIYDAPTKDPQYEMKDGASGQLEFSGSSASELSAAVGEYFREYCNITIGWPRGGGCHRHPQASGWLQRVGCESCDCRQGWSIL